MGDAINPEYYKNSNSRQLIDLVELLPFALGNAVKYVYRAGVKNESTFAEDVDKAIWYVRKYFSNPVFLSSNEIDNVTVNEVLNGIDEKKTIIIKVIVNIYLASYYGENLRSLQDNVLDLLSAYKEGNSI